MEYMFRDLRADEIDCRVAQMNDKGLSLLLYKDARVDMDILDEKVGPLGWQREHKELKSNIYCGISLKDDKGNWVTKWDCGKESNTQAEKGEASDSFKRAGFNWGIGRELYTAPFIYVPLQDSNNLANYELKDGKLKTKFRVEAIEIVDKKITKISIINDKNKRVFVKQGA